MIRRACQEKREDRMVCAFGIDLQNCCIAFRGLFEKIKQNIFNFF